MFKLFTEEIQEINSKLTHSNILELEKIRKAGGALLKISPKDINSFTYYGFAKIKDLNPYWVTFQFDTAICNMTVEDEYGYGYVYKLLSDVRLDIQTTVNDEVDYITPVEFNNRLTACCKENKIYYEGNNNPS